ncbi:MAG: methyltransferase [Actinomycetota bacterium]|nr:methyltransferase [Actinomycetota bacterium]MDQ2955351.1 methyltransferase [Actinomycetota bacterium]
MTSFAFDRLRRFPDVEAPNLFAVDATDRLLLDTAAQALADAGPGELAIVGDHYGALTLGAAGRFGSAEIRTQQDLLTGEQALAANAERLELAGCYRSYPLAAGLFSDVGVVLIQAPKNLDALRETVELISHEAPAGVEVYVGGRVKHLTPAINAVLAEAFDEVRASLARQKSRVISASAKRADLERLSFPRKVWHADLGLWICAHGAAFAGAKIDLGTRRLLALLDRMRPDAAEAIDLGCGTGVLAAALAMARPELRVLASDSSAAAVASAQATMAANELTGRVSVQRDDALATVAEASAELIVCNPPFHLDNAIHEGAASRLFQAAGRVLAPGGELWTVCNAHLDYRAELRTLVGRTEVAHRDPKFTVTVSRKA